jgi:hypothetical protein
MISGCQSLLVKEKAKGEGQKKKESRRLGHPRFFSLGGLGSLKMGEAGKKKSGRLNQPTQQIQY